MALHPFPISDEQLAKLASTRGGRVALGGFEYQRAFALWRLAALLLRQPLAGGSEIAIRMRYEWAEDIDELCEDGSVLMWQCKHGPGWHSAAPLAELLCGFAAKYLWTPADQRHRLRFRLATSDREHAAHHDQPAPLPEKSKTRTAFLEILDKEPGEKSDRALWKDEAKAFGHAALFDALFDATRVLYVPATTATGRHHWEIEQRAVDALAGARRIADPGQSELIVQALRPLLDVQPHRPQDASGLIDRPALAPSWFFPADVEGRLWQFSSESSTRGLSKSMFDRVRMRQILLEPRGTAYVARQPTWADVVRGADAELLFFERTNTDALFGRMVRALDESRSGDGKLRLQPVLGAPGAGKSTLALRVAARLVLEGHCVVIDRRHPLDSEEPTDDLIDSLDAVSNPARPTLLLLDDPLGTNSGWPRLLEMLGRKRPALVVLTAMPDFLWDRYKHDLRAPIHVLTPLALAKPDAAEREALAALHPGVDATLLLESDEELLVLAMQAATGQSFDAIIESLWLTLSDRAALPSHVLGKDIPWPVAAFMVVCWFHRAYALCPELLLSAFLATREDVGEGAAEERLGMMELRKGWHIFQFIKTAGPGNFSFQGGQVASMHARVAQRSWELRPGQAWNLPRALAAATASAAPSSRLLGMALATVHQEDPEGAALVASEIARAWRQLPDELSVATRDICSLVSMLQSGRLPVPMEFLDTLRTRTTSLRADSWLASIPLHFHSHPDRKQRSFPPNLALDQLIANADFSLAPGRATLFANALEGNGAALSLFNQRLWRAFDGELSWALSSTLINWLLSRGDGEQIKSRLPRLRAWLQDHPNDTAVRAAFVNLERHHVGILSPADVDESLAWLALHPGDTNVRTGLLNLLQDRADPRLIALLRETLSKVQPGTSFFQPASTALKVCGSLPSTETALICECLEWATATLDFYRGNNAATTIATSVSQAVRQVNAWIRSATLSPDLRARASSTLATLDAAIKRWEQSLRPKRAAR